jgi:hypothetical protein
MLAGMFFQIVVALAALAISAVLLAPSNPPAIVYWFIIGIAVWGATWLRALIQHGPDVEVRFTPNRFLYGEDGRTQWLGRREDDHGLYWRLLGRWLHRRFIVPGNGGDG